MQNALKCIVLTIFETNKQKTLVISTHGIEKKTGKVPKNEILKAENLRAIYFEL